MKNFDTCDVSMEMQNAIDSYVIELYEKNEKKTVAEMSKDLDNVAISTIYKYIKYCIAEIKKASILKCIMCTIVFKKGGRNDIFYDIQKQYLERLEEVNRRRKASVIAKKLYERQQQNKKECK